MKPALSGFADGRGFLLDRGRFTRIDVPGVVSTVARGHSQVVGGYLDAAGRFHGFLWDKGRFTAIDVPGAGGTTATDINNRRQIVGEYGENPDNAPTALHGFLLSGGDYTTFDGPGVLFTEPGDINDRGQIVGSTASDRALREVHGFLLDVGVEGPFTPIDFPGAPRAVAFDINDRGQIVGVYENPDAAPDDQQSPMRIADDDVGRLTADAPVPETASQERTPHVFDRRHRSSPAPAVVISVALAVLAVPMAQASAESSTPFSPTPGFLLDRGRYTTIEIRGALVETAPLGINDRGEMAGAYEDGKSDRGFMRDRRGRVITIDVPGAQGTAAQKSNDRGQITDVYSDTSPDTQDPGAPERGFLLDR